MPFWSWSKTAASNASADSTVNYAEGQAPSSLNDSARAAMAALAKWRDDVSGTLTTGGTSTAYTLTTQSVFDTAAHMSGALICFIPHATSGAAPTLAVDGLTARAINKSTGVAIATGTLVVGTPYFVTYIHATTEFILVQTPGVVFGALAANAVLTAAITDANVTYAKLQNVAHGAFLGRVSAAAGVAEEAVLMFGQCQLSKSGSNLLLAPYKGNRLTINSLVETIPDSGPTLSTGGLSANTTYYVYAYMSAGTMTLEASATGYATQAGTGVTIKSGDATRTLVGQARVNNSTAFADSIAQRFVRSWFNDPAIALSNNFTAARSTASTSYVEVNTEIRIEFLVWTGEIMQLMCNGRMVGSTANGQQTASIGIDGTTAEDAWAYYEDVTGGALGSTFTIPLYKTGLSEGYHYATLLGKSGGGGNTVTWDGSASAAARTTMKGFAKLN